jgi:hypothetical protein
MRITILTGITILFLPLLLWSYSSGPPDDVACNPPFFDSCVMCHNDFPENSGDGSLSILGVPPSYNPGSTYNITVTIEDPGQERWGFELTTLDTADCQAGVLIVTDTDSTQLSNNSGCNPDYIMQTSLGTHTGVLDGPVSWRFDWQAPGSGTGTVTFYSAGLAANDAAGTNGDYVYCTSVSTDEIQAVHDGGVIALQAPDTVCADSTENLCVTVENFGNAADTFLVISTVDGFADTTVIPDLASGDTTTICFNWTVLGTGNFTFTSCTQVQGDTNSANDCSNRPIVSIDCGIPDNHDGGVVAIQAPDTVCMDSTSNLCVTVENFGNVSDTFVVISTVDGFADTTSIPDLAPGDTATICFNWTAIDTGNYTFTSCTQVQGDTNSANDCDNTPIVSIICVGVEESELPASPPEVIALHQNTPNPFIEQTEIRYALNEGASITLGVFDISGQRVQALVNGFEENGVYSVIWDGKDESGVTVGSGIYFYRLTAGEIRITKKLVLLK